MALTVRTNTTAQSALTNLNKTSRALQRSFERLSSGKRISRAADDAAGLGAAERLHASSTSAVVAARNVNDGISIISVAEGAASEVGSILTRMRELAVQGASDTLSTNDRSYVSTEFKALSKEVDRIAAVTEYNGTKLANGTVTALNVQVGIHATTNDQIAITTGDLTATTLTVDTTSIDMSTAAGASASLAKIDSAIDTVTGYRSGFGAVENRLGNALNNLETFSTATSAAESRIRDADFGQETATLTQNQVLQQAGVAVLAQAKGINQGALSLLQ